MPEIKEKVYVIIFIVCQDVKKPCKNIPQVKISYIFS